VIDTNPAEIIDGLSMIIDTNLLDMEAKERENDRLRAALRKILVGASTQGAFTGMSWSEAADICLEALAGPFEEALAP